MKNATKIHAEFSVLCLTLFCLVFFASAAQAVVDVTFSWLPNQEPQLDGYKIHYGTTSGSYTTTVEIGNPSLIDSRVHGTVTGLNEGETYYFVATAYDTGGLESDYSIEVPWTAPSQSGGVNPPVATAGSITTSEDIEVNGQLQAEDLDNDTLTYSKATSPAHGTVTVNSNGTFTYTPGTDYSGTDNFTFTAYDGLTTSNPATVSITITAINDPPTANDVTITVSEDSSINGQLQAQDIDSSTGLTYSVVSPPTHGALTANTTGGFTYAPEANATGTDSFTYLVTDGQATSNTATVSITISPVNDAPVALTGSLSAPFERTTAGVLRANDVDNDPLTYSIATDPQHLVTITNSATGAYNFTPVDGMLSPYAFTFTVNDGTTNSSPATVSAIIFAANTVAEIFGDTPDSNHPGTLADTYTNLNDSINASSDQITTWSWASPTPHKPANTIIIKTDLTLLKDKIEVIEAKLHLYQTSATGEATYNNSLHMITGKNPIIDQVTGNNAYNGELWTPVEEGTTSNNTPLGLADIDQEAEDTISVGMQAGYKTWLITELVQKWISDSDSNFGLLIKGVPTATQTGRIFASSENVNASFRPKLVIRYIGKPPKPNVHSARQVK